jgi:hypothetical protein
MSTQPRRLLILRWTRNHPALGAPAPWLFDLPPAGPSREPSGQLGCRGGLGTPLARRAA